MLVLEEKQPMENVLRRLVNEFVISFFITDVAV